MEGSVGIDVRGDVDDLGEVGIRVGRSWGGVGEHTGEVGHGVAAFGGGGLEAQLGERLASCAFAGEFGTLMERVGEHGDLAVEVSLGWGHGKLGVRSGFSVGRLGVQRDTGEGEELGGVLGLDPRRAEIPAAGDVEGDLEAELVGGLEGVEIEFIPGRAGEERTGGDVVVTGLVGTVGVYEEDSSVAFVTLPTRRYANLARP